ncbi:SRPBCC family protein [Streptomyces sp. SID6673]|nr:SRPBCC family protein [Streptomyces sp. SID11726]NEB23859.1 SRPBCC family protein [Streptomyces sp. SID6673]
MPLLQKDEAVSASVPIRATPHEIYAIIADITRTPEWSPETVRAVWLTQNKFRAWNRRRLGRWRTEAEVTEAIPGQTFSYVVHAMGGEWTRWTYSLETLSADETRLTETCRMCVALPTSVAVFERLALFVGDRRTDLHQNLEASLQRIKAIAEGKP